MKKLIVVLSVMILGATMTGCGNTDEPKIYTVQTVSASGEWETSEYAEVNGELIKIDGHIFVEK